jgi:hypothetical protein
MSDALSRLSDALSQLIGEILNGDGLPLSQAAKHVPSYRGDGTASASTPWRWATKGARAADGRIVKLETARIGGRMLTSKAALARFAAALSSPPDDSAPSPSNPTTPKPRTPAERRRAADAATRRLAEAGA